ncbi:MAG TPA: histone deacetylase [Methylomirabilota bacterium]|nr:histone deacetylase [Methylomirabilota bacterium]
MITAFYHPGFAAPIGDHIMPMGKFALVADGLKSIPGIRLAEPAPVTDEELCLVHTPEYITAVRTGTPRVLAESQKFPWTPALFPSVCLTNGACLAAARQARRDGVAAALASGFHHAHADHGEGFCTFNGLVIAADALRSGGEVHTVAILDLDLHYGNGTAGLAATRPWLTAVSIYGNDYKNNAAYRDVTVRHHENGSNHFSAALPAGCDGKHLHEILDQHLPALVTFGKPDLLLYQAGADPLQDDPYSPLALSHADLLERDRRVFEFARRHAIPIAWVLAGGYTQDLTKVVEVHLNTFRAAAMVFAGQA